MGSRDTVNADRWRPLAPSSLDAATGSFDRAGGNGDARRQINAMCGGVNVQAPDLPVVTNPECAAAAQP